MNLAHRIQVMRNQMKIQKLEAELEKVQGKEATDIEAKIVALQDKISFFKGK